MRPPAQAWPEAAEEGMARRLRAALLLVRWPKESPCPRQGRPSDV
jgi:hypothetical protein